MVMERFDIDDDPRSQKYRAVTKRVLVLDTKQPVTAAALLGDLTSSYLDQTRLGSFSVKMSRSTESVVGGMGSPGVMSSIHVSSNSYHITTSFNVPVTHRPMTSSSIVTRSIDLIESSMESSSELFSSEPFVSPFSTIDPMHSPSLSVSSLDFDAMLSVSIDDTHISIPVSQSSVFNPSSVSLLPSEVSTFVTMETNQMMSSGHYPLSSTTDVLGVSSVPMSSVVATDRDNVTPSFYPTSFSPSDVMTSFPRSEVTSLGYTTQESTVHSYFQTTASQHHVSSESTLSSTITDISTTNLHSSEADISSKSEDHIISSSSAHLSTAFVLSSSLDSHSSTVDEKMKVTSSYISDSMMLHDVSSTSPESGSVLLKSSSQPVISPSSYRQQDVSTPLLSTSVSSHMSVSLISSLSTPFQSSLTFDLITTTPNVLESGHLIATLVPTRVSVLMSSWVSGNDGQSSTHVQSSVHPTLVTEETTSLYVSESTETTITSTHTTPTSNPCPTGQAPCEDGSCLSADKFCDGVANCPDASDEARDCSCGSGQFKCSSGQCVPSQARCNGHLQCKDKTDEFNCSGCFGFQCASGLCLWTHSSRCDQVIDCDDLSDELGCPFRPGFKRCTNGIFILASDWCDGVDDCYDNSDETQCVCDPHTEVACQDGGCIRLEWVCDGVWDCTNGTDEEDCDRCNSTEFVCPDYQCVAMDTVCDGHHDCSGGADELNCFYIASDDQFNLSLSTGQLLVQHSGQIQPICSSHWTQQLSHHMCRHLGHEKSIQTVYTPEMSSPQNSYFELKSDVLMSGTSEILSNIVNVTTCSNGSVVNISCSKKECGKRSGDFLTAYIAGGELSPLGKWPWVVSLTYLGEPLCAAAIVTSQWLVTAGHCVALPGVHDYIQTPFYVQASAGSVKRSTDQKSRSNMVAADRIVQHPNFTYTGLGSILWDLALVHLEQPLTFTEVIQPICLPLDENSNHDNCYLAGWGFLDNDGGQLPQYLREAKVQVWDDETCRRDTVPLETSVNTNITLCAGYTGGILSGCQGDSGGPLMCEATRGRWFLAGVLSSGSANCAVATTHADRYTRVSALSEWISNITGTL
ncbi:Atrial natriuretic peptide-converting enzyme [Mizuhopecten yessoensis]|uniref:Atrial natriuretic peptide-converting enzyme n=1 Tax=Mizuhopecten yessoensis TaxID=6573 RepID=A0A210QAG7_MIZYE|nr:Atrial natriuretic peptide-converting enzyme [Mizuhopecten yessoensis]